MVKEELKLRLYHKKYISQPLNLLIFYNFEVFLNCTRIMCALGFNVLHLYNKISKFQEKLA